MGSLITEVFVPVVLLCVGMAFTKVQFFIDAEPRLIDPTNPTAFGDLKTNVFINSNLMTTSIYDINPNELLKFSDQFVFQSLSTPSNSPSTPKDRSSALSKFDEDIFAKSNSEAPYNYLGYYVMESNNFTKQFLVAAMMNVTGQDVLPISTQLLYESIL